MIGLPLLWLACHAATAAPAAAPPALRRASLSGSALSDGLDLPVTIRGAQVRYTGAEGRAHFTGGVTVVRGTATLFSDELWTLKGSTEAVARGHVRLLDETRTLDLASDELGYTAGLRQVTGKGSCRLLVGVAEGRTTVLSDELELLVDSREATAKGSVRIWQGGSEAICGQARLFAAEDRVVLTGRPVLRRPPHEFECDEVTTWFREGRSVLSGRVQGRLAGGRLELLEPGSEVR